ncbi:MAG: hypothetical protein RL186_1631, partial [Pseudomonadota bacterium]
MQAKINRRTLVQSSLASAMGYGVLGQTLTPTPALARNWFTPRGAGRFERLLATTTGAVPAGMSDFAFRLPDATPGIARLAYPLVVTKRLKVLLFCADMGARASQYDSLIGALAAHNFFVLALDGPPIGEVSSAGPAGTVGTAEKAKKAATTSRARRTRRARTTASAVPEVNQARVGEPPATDFVAKARFLLDLVDSAAAVLGDNAKKVDTDRMGAIGHGDGAWMAAALGGWDRNGAPSTISRD